MAFKNDSIKRCSELDSPAQDGSEPVQSSVVHVRVLSPTRRKLLLVHMYSATELMKLPFDNVRIVFSGACNSSQNVTTRKSWG